MKSVIIFGKNHAIIEQKSDKNSVQLKNGRIFMNHGKLAGSTLKEFLADLLYSQVSKSYDRMRKRGVEVFGNLDFEIVDKIDNKRQRVAKLKGDKILIKLNAVALPTSALEYIIAHEIAHIYSKRHTKKFWKIVETIYPRYKKGQELFLKYRDILSKPYIY
jgi:predicted metal-dependent hydrolase